MIGLAVSSDGLLKWTKKGAVFIGSSDDADSNAFDNRGNIRK